MSQTLPFALTAFGLPHTLGYQPTREGVPNPAPMSRTHFLDVAKGMGLAGVEMPLPPDPSDRAALRDALVERNLRILPAHPVVTSGTVEEFHAFLRSAADLNAPVVRVILSSMLCGDRRSAPGGSWNACLDAIVQRLNAVLPFAEELGVCIAIENHQDATSDDLLQLHERTGSRSALGICLDTGNSLAVGEGPLEFARRTAPLIRHIHLKDYTIHFAPEGYRLVRCPAGKGVVPFPELLALVKEHGQVTMPGIEIAALATRTIPLLEPWWWEYYPPTHSRHLPEALRVLWKQGRPQDEPYGSAWERGEDSPTLLREEWDVLMDSVAYFRSFATG